ncbi:LysR family transcriptional regulator [Celeribacter indicus]|nr:LysR family transcriptional regulator [Celeribacter indicus]SDX28915.1 transcriptional regulator, LysR family [Celeribacter indicus]
MNGLNNLDLNLLKLFDAIYRERSVSAAADRLNMTQPAASNALNRLRQALGDQLFVRTRSGMEPTLLAQSIAGPVQQGLKEIGASILEGMSFCPEESERSFTMLATDVGEETYIAALMKILETSAPNIDIRVLEAPLEDYENLLEFGYADFAIGRLEISDRFMREHIASCCYSVLLCAQYAEEIGVAEDSVIPYELYLSLRHVNVLTRATPANRHPVDMALRQMNGQRRVVLTLPHASVLSGILPGTTLVATVPGPAIEPLRARANLVQARLPFETEMLHVLLVWHRRQQLDKGHSWMRDQFRAMPMTSWDLSDMRATG